jgi:hypothetical protein
MKAAKLKKQINGDVIGAVSPFAMLADSIKKCIACQGWTDFISHRSFSITLIFFGAVSSLMFHLNKFGFCQISKA